jgi:hypothetical protein
MSATPPSKPDRRVSRIRLSSRWVLSREGAALRAVPKFVRQTFGITQAIGTRLIPPLASPRGHSRWFSLPSACLSTLPPSCVPWLHGHYPFHRYYGRSDSRQPGSRTVRPFRPPAPAGLPGYFAETSDHSVSNHPRVVRGPPGCPTIRLLAYRLLTGFATRSQARPSTLTESSPRRLPHWTACVTDWSFSFRCSPPRVATTQLRFDTARLLTAQEQTSTALSLRTPRRTTANRPRLAAATIADPG